MRTILIVDDEQQMRERFKKALAADQFRVVEAQSAIDVADILMRERIDLILLDINIPEVDGHDIFDIIAEYPTSATVPVIVTSVYPISEQKIRVRKAADYFDKAHSDDTLIKKINKQLGIS